MRFLPTLKTFSKRSLLVAGVSLAFGLSACTSTLQLQNQFPSRDARDLIGVGLSYIKEAYVLELDLGTVAVAGLEGLSDIDSNFRVRRSANGVITQIDNIAREYRVTDTNSANAWARATNSAIEGARMRSQKLAASDTEDLYRAIFNGYEDELDQFSRYLEPEQASNEEERFLGFGGIGITIDNEVDGIRVVEVLRGSPADRGGLKKGDLIIAVNNQVFAPNRPLRERTPQLKGPIGSRVQVSVRRGANGQLSTYSLRRDEVISESVELDLEGDIAFLRILTFNRNTAERVLESIKEAQLELAAKRTPLRGVVLDVRDNGGGLRTAVVELADLVMEEGLITSTRGRISRANRKFEAKGDDELNGLPIIVQINESSASASELLAAALQDNARAVVLGSTSFGKGSVQSKLPLPNRGEFALTTARFYAPSGAPLHDYGVVPSVCTSDNTLTPNALIQEIFAGRKPLPSAQARRALNQDPQITKNQYRSLCPPSEASPDRDDTLAKLILSDRRIYAALLSAYARDSR